MYENKVTTWTITEITSVELLDDESNAMHHCVFRYLERCANGFCTIFSVKIKPNNEKNFERIATVEISRNFRLMQARGKFNRKICEETMNVITIWAKENNLGIDDENHALPLF
jgi:hypothetical protein